jgi:phosphonate transport system substrate-binding protein
LPKLGILFAIIVGLVSCRGPSGKEQVLRVGFVPSENMQRVMDNARPVVEVLRKGLGMEIEPFVAVDYTGVVEALRSGKLDVAFLNPASYVLAKKEADIRVIVKSQRQGKAYFYSAIITHKDSGIRELKDLKNRSFAFGDPLSTSGHVFPKNLLKEHGIDPQKDFTRVIYSGGHDATVLAVFHRKVDAGATYANTTTGDGSWKLYLKDPKEQEMIRVLAYSEPIPSDNLVIRNSLDPSLGERIEKIFLHLSETPEGQKILKDLYFIDGFVRASDSDYDSIRAAFEKAGIKLKEELRKNY